MLTAELIRSLAPRARQDYVDAFVNGAATLERWGFATPARLAALLATALHETGGLTIVRESMNYTTPSRLAAVWPSRFGKYDSELEKTVVDLAKAAPFVRNEKRLANSVYGGRMGNQRNGTADDDGYRFRGGGLPQLTGYDNYLACEKAIGVPLSTQPELIEDANVSLAALCWEMSKFHQFCDMGERGWRAVCNGINRGNPASTLDPIGWADRQLHYSRCCDALGITGKSADDTLRLGDQGPLVKALQERLTALGYALGRTDGVFGSRMRAAVLAFQAENEIATDGVIGAQTRAALNAEAARPMPLGERVTETAADLKAAGSTTIENTDKLKAVAKTAVAASATVGAVKETGALDAAQIWLTEMSLMKTTTTGLIDVVMWAGSKWYIALIVGGYFVYRWAKKIEFRRVLEHKLGMNLSK